MGSSSGGSQPQVTTQSSTPWAGVQPFLSNMYSTADAFRGGNVGYTPYAGPTQADMDPDLVNSLNWQRAIATGTISGSPDVNAGINQATNMIANQGMTPGIQNSISGLQGTANNYNSLFQQAQGQQNPYLLAQIADSNRRIADKVNSSVSGAGRYGSGAHTDVLSRSLAESADPILAQDYAQRQQQALAANQGLGSTYNTMSDIYGQGLQRAGQWAQLAPTLDAAQYAPAERLMSTGQFLSNRGQLSLQDQIKLYNAQQAYPWEQLSREAGILSGAGSLGGTSVTSTNPYQPSSLQSGLGGALAGAGLGASFGGPLGAGAGALGGGLLGLLR